MDQVMIILLVAYLVLQMLRYCLDFMNISYMKRYGTKVPEGFEGYLDEALLRKTYAYAVENNTFSLVESAFGSGITIVFLYGGLLGRYASWISSFTASFILQGVVFFLFLSYASSLLSVPFSLYRTFRIENKYGFNTMNARLWVMDFMKSTLVSTAVTVVVCSGGLWIVRQSPDLWWLFVWGFFLVFSIFLMYLSPYVIEPLFNKFTPLEGEGLEHRIMAMMERTGIRISRVFRVDASRRSHHTNAYFTGIGRTKRIVLYDTLLGKMNEDEVLAVLAHEAGHWKKRHVLKMILISEVLSFAGIYIAFRMLKSGMLANAFGLGGNTFFAELVILGFVFSIVSFPFTPLLSAFSRRHEREADRFAVELSPRPDALATSLIKLSKDNLSNLHPHPLYAAIYYSHPPVVERIRSIHEMAGARQ